MILSHRHRFIFMHPRKTGGSSVSLLLNRHLGPRDLQLGTWPDTIAHGGGYNLDAVLTALSAPRELLRRTRRRPGAARRFGLDPEVVNAIQRRHFRTRHGFEHTTHVCARTVRDYAPDAWARYFKFCVVRNPWDHAVSDYYWRLSVRGRPEIGFGEFVRRLADPGRPDPEGLRPPVITNWDICAIDDEIALDRVARYETLAEDLAGIGARIGLALDISAVRAKGGLRDRSLGLRDHYDDTLIELVAGVYAREIRAFGYAPPF